MRRLRLLIMVASVMLAVVLVGVVGPAGAGRKAVYYLALGDSLASGCSSGDFQSNFGHYYGCGGHGYDNQLAEREHKEFPSLHLVNLSCGGETTDSFIFGHRADCYSKHPPGISQLDDAVGFLEAHPGQIAFITIDIGGNDALGTCWDFGTGVIDKACIEHVLPHIQSNLANIVETLEAAAPGTPVVGMNYYDPFLGYWVLIEGGDQVAQADEDAWEALDAGLVSTYQGHGALVADVAGPDFFNTADFSDTVVTKEFGEVPVNVANACAWTYFCAKPPFGPLNVHATTEGYGVIADAFEAALAA
jgi:lysophospholipase L1-like esterase